MSSRKYLIRRIAIIIVALVIVGTGLFFVLAKPPEETPAAEINGFYPLALAIEESTTFDVTFINSSELGVLGVFVLVPTDMTPGEFEANIQASAHIVAESDFQTAAVRFIIMGEAPTYGVSKDAIVEHQSVATFQQIQFFSSAIKAYHSGELSWEALKAQASVQSNFGFIGDPIALSWIGE